MNNKRFEAGLPKRVKHEACGILVKTISNDDDDDDDDDDNDVN
jgi:hypothetical protein